METTLSAPLRFHSGEGCRGPGDGLTVICELPDLLPTRYDGVPYAESFATATFVMIVERSGPIDIQSTVRSRFDDSDETNNSGQASIVVTAPPPVADLHYVGFTIDPRELVDGERQRARLTFEIENAGPAAAIDAHFRVFLPPTAVFEGFDEGDPICRISRTLGGLVTCNLPDLLPRDAFRPADRVRVVFVITVGPDRSIGSATMFFRPGSVVSDPDQPNELELQL